MTVNLKTGLGHQFKEDQKAVEAGKKSLEEAFAHFTNVKGVDAQILALKVTALINDANEITYAMDEAYHQNA